MVDASVTVTVILPVRNAESTIAAAVHSILQQTYPDFRLLVIDDGSTDGTAQVVESIADPRIDLVHNSSPEGLPRSLNRGLDRARAPYIARMDADDISHPRRLEKQVAMLNARPEIGVVGTWARASGISPTRVWRYPIEPCRARCELIFRTPLIHPSVMIRRSVLEEHGLRYDEGLNHSSEDWDLWQRCIEHTQITNVPEVLLDYRVGPTSNEIKVAKHKDFVTATRRALQRHNVAASQEDIELHVRFGLRDFTPPAALEQSERWLQRLVPVDVSPCSARDLHTTLGRAWFEVCYATSDAGLSVLRRFRRSPLYDPDGVSRSEWLRFVARVLLRKAPPR